MDDEFGDQKADNNLRIARENKERRYRSKQMQECMNQTTGMEILPLLADHPPRLEREVAKKVLDLERENSRQD
jgi:hypothetical protein